MLRRSSFLTLIGATGVAALVLPELDAVSAAAATTYSSKGATLYKSGARWAGMKGVNTATNTAVICNRGVDYTTAHGGAPVAGRYTTSGITILRAGSAIGTGTNSADAVDVAAHLNFGEATATTGGVGGTNLLPATIASTAIGAAAFKVGGNNLPVLVGSASLSAVSTTAGGNYWIQPVGNFIGVTAGNAYTALASYQPLHTISASSQLQWYTAAGTLISYTKGPVSSVASASTTQLIATGTAPAGAALATVQVTVDADGNGSNTIVFTHLGLFAGTTVTTWSAGTGALAAVPGAPTAVTAVGGNGQAVVTFTPPTNTGGSPITSYTVTATSVS